MGLNITRELVVEGQENCLNFIKMRFVDWKTRLRVSNENSEQQSWHDHSLFIAQTI